MLSKTRLGHIARTLLSVIAIAALVSLGVLGARQVRWLERLELELLDRDLEWMPSPGRSGPRAALVEVTERDIQNLGSYPIPDAIIARIIDVLTQSGARAVGSDIYRDLPVPPGSDELDAVLYAEPRVIFVSKFADAVGGAVEAPVVLRGTDRVGFNNLVLDPDGILRRGLLYMDDGRGGTGTALSLQLALLYLGDEGVHPAGDPDDPATLVLGASRLTPLSSSFGGYAGIDAGGFQYLLDQRGPQVPLPRASLTELLAGEADPEIFRDRMVILGVSAESLGDRFRLVGDSPADVGVGSPGAEVHARMADQLVRHALGELTPIRAAADWQEVALVLVSAALGTGLAVWLRLAWGLLLLGVSGLGVLWSFGWLALWYGSWLPVAAPAIAWVASLSLTAAHARGREWVQRKQLMQLFSRHVTRQVAEEVWRRRDEFLAGGRPKPVRLTATALFVDIKGYTGTAEKLDPAELMEWIDGFLRAIAQEVLDRDGVVEDYFGDGMMACFGIPIPRTEPDAVRNDARSAVVSALGMEQVLHRLNAEWRAEGRPAIAIRVGISTGSVVAGSMGSADRIKYGVVGDAVVTAQRLESLGVERIEHDFQRHPARILVSEATRTLLDASFQTELMGEFVVKGKVEPVTVHRVVGRDTAGIGSALASGGSERCEI